MKIKITAGVLIVVATAFLMRGSAIAQDRASMNKITMDNLSTAMHGEAFAYAKYMLYAQHARQSGNTELATLFETSAKTERFEHLAAEAKLAGLVGTDADNLKDAMRGESYEVETMYREFAEQAAAAGDKAAADRFEEIRHDEMKHRDAFKAALAQLERKSAVGK
jgi:rubrerythrin